ncbi:N-acetyl-gamma-glutamyl-phosphate reductase [Aquihabitans sp. G128]|uniref:N-acetyl-gamma-glutamyl-phosphate reductase n=1 Tax=Aquihabitans sp. G128 TaxID=2849779 RepID=UPI001C215724|nr:N-acetyl-gamma-glutamyl-phosphate reductase [Aquihabitans sp. G128]QXC61920.1 N-acetyl-gamma-glutamyl-phosphate reductase [Aquihabitans sp. G128]
MATRVGIVGASGFTGAELLRLIAGHPDLEVVVATGDTQAGNAVAALYPSLAGAYPGLTFAAYGPGLADAHDLDLVFCGLPHGTSQEIVPGLLDGNRIVVDLGADFRLKDAGLYPTWYGVEHTVPELLEESVYGLPELFREELRTAKLIATPGCYVTTATLALAPLLRAGLVEPTGIVVDAASGVSGAGRAPKPGNAFNTVDENFVAYGMLSHRHTPEIEQNLTHVAGDDVQVLFTPHLAPMNRGILATCYARPTQAVTTESLREALRAAYADEPFVVVLDEPPSTKATLGSQSVHVTAYADERTGWVVALAALDNLTKGASGGALQSANLALGLPEATGLPIAGLYP